MSLRKTAGLLAAFGLMVGLIGGGVGAVFTDQVIADENISVGTFGCEISATTAGTIAPSGNSVVYDAPPIMSSAPASAPFSFTVLVTGDIATKLHVTETTPPAPFTSLFNDLGDVTLTAGGTRVYDVGLEWPELGFDDMGDSASITYTVDCLEGSTAPLAPNAPMASTNAINQTNGWANVTSVPGVGTVELTFHQPRAFYACFEYRTDGDTNQKLSDTNWLSVYVPGLINDGLYPYVCLSTAGSSATVDLGPTIGYVEFRMVFGAEGSERFDWTRVDAL